MPLNKGWSKKKRKSTTSLGPNPNLGLDKGVTPKPISKPTLKSRTIMGGSLILLSVALKYYGFSLDFESKKEFVAIISNLISLFGGFLTIYGRIKASKPK